MRFPRLVVPVVIFCCASWMQAREFESQYGWGVDRGIVHRTVITMEPGYLELYARLKGSVLGQRGYIGLVLPLSEGVEVVPGVAMWHQNGTGKIDAISAWLRVHVGSERLRFGVDWGLNSTQYHVRGTFALNLILPFETKAYGIITFESGSFFTGPIVGMQVEW